MKKILVFILAALLLCAFAVSASAETSSDMLTSTENENAGNSDPEKENAGNSDPEKENATESEISPDTAIPEDPAPTPTEPEKTLTDNVVEYITSHVEEITVIVSLVCAAVYSKIKDGKFGATLGTLNSNAIKIANKGAEVAEAAADKMDAATVKLKELEEKFGSLMAKYEQSETEKAALAALLSHVESLLKSVKGAALEASNEVAELLVRANLPNSVKEEIYGRHMKAVHELEAAEEGTVNDGKKA